MHGHQLTTIYVIVCEVTNKVILVAILLYLHTPSPAVAMTLWKACFINSISLFLSVSSCFWSFTVFSRRRTYTRRENANCPVWTLSSISWCTWLVRWCNSDAVLPKWHVRDAILSEREKMLYYARLISQHFTNNSYKMIKLLKITTLKYYCIN